MHTCHAMLARMAHGQNALQVPSGDDLAALRSACVKVTCEDGSVGSGYFVTPDKVVTCQHVVRHVKKDGQVTLTLFDGSSRPALLERAEASTDVALLRLTQPTSITPLRVVPTVARNRPFELVGYPKTLNGQYLLLNGTVHDPVGRDRRGASAIVLYSDLVAGGQGALMHGYSGSPVLVDGAVVGHLSRVLLDGEAERPTAEMGLVFATPGGEVLRFLEGEVPAPATAPPQPPGAGYSPEWYVPRTQSERLALAYLERPGAPAVLHGPRQSGKGWLLRHVVREWRRRWPQSPVVRIDLLSFHGLTSLEELTRQLAYKLTQELNGDESWLRTYERDQGRATPMNRLETMVRLHVLRGGHPVLLALDSTDAILGRDYTDGFFGALRAWMQYDFEPWEQLRILMAVSTTPSRIIRDTERSFFNLNKPVSLPPLSVDEVGQLGQRHGLGLAEPELKALHELTGGHPYLVRRALFDAAMADGKPGTLPLSPTAEAFAAHLRSLSHFVERERLVAAARAGAAESGHRGVSG